MAATSWSRSTSHSETFPTSRPVVASSTENVAWLPSDQSAALSHQARAVAWSTTCRAGLNCRVSGSCSIASASAASSADGGRSCQAPAAISTCSIPVIRCPRGVVIGSARRRTHRYRASDLVGCSCRVHPHVLVLVDEPLGEQDGPALDRLQSEAGLLRDPAGGRVGQRV